MTMHFTGTRFVDLGQQLYIQWLASVRNADTATEEERRKAFKFAAQLSFEAAEEFAKVFDNQEDE